MVAAVALAAAALVFLAPLPPGLDVPWHAAVIKVLATPAAARAHDFLGTVEVHWQIPTYASVYLTAAGLARLLGDVALALEIVTALYVVAMVWASYSLLRALGQSGALAVLAAPAAFSLTLEYGFLTYAVAYPATLWLWASCIRLGRGGRVPRELAVILACSLFLGFTHPFAALIGVGGALLALLLADGGWRSRALAGLATLIGFGPALWGVLAMGGDGSAGGHALAGLGLGDRLLEQDFTRVDESIVAAPARLFGFMPPAWRFALLAAALVVALLARHRAPPTGSRRPAGWLFGFVVALYLVTPYSFFWPRYWYAVQPRLLPLVWVMALALLAGRPSARTVWAPLGVALAGLAALWFGYFAGFVTEARDFEAVIAAVPPASRTLVLIEEPRAREREPAGPLRHFGAWIVAAKGGLVPHLPMNEPGLNGGSLIPVVPAPDRPSLPAAPPPFEPRTFDPGRHHGWDLLLIHDQDEAARFDYTAKLPDAELMAQRGKWRLFQLPTTSVSR